MSLKHRTKLRPNESELKDQLIKVNRVAKTTKGGRSSSFNALVVVGNKEGVVGYGLGKASEVAKAIKKATNEAIKKIYRFPLRDNRTLYHKVSARYKGTEVIIIPAGPGTGNHSAKNVGAVLSAVGISDSLAKINGSTNPHNVIKATFAALAQMSSPQQKADLRGISLDKLFNG